MKYEIQKSSLASAQHPPAWEAAKQRDRTNYYFYILSDIKRLPHL